MRAALLLSIAICLAGTSLRADPAIGLWRTEPDRKDLTSHIEIRACGAKLCGRILRAFDPAGREVRTPNVGKELFWDVAALGGGRYGGGTVWVPLLNIRAAASMRLEGARLRVTACKGPLCDGQVWTRVN